MLAFSGGLYWFMLAASVCWFMLAASVHRLYWLPLPAAMLVYAGLYWLASVCWFLLAASICWFMLAVLEQFLLVYTGFWLTLVNTGSC